jgi:uncharacterized damage-inducible protein DinB
MPDLSHSQSGYDSLISTEMSDPDGLVWLQSLCFHKKCQMPEIELIADQLKRAFDGEAWHGPALIEILDGIDAKTAASHSIRDAHSIWELVLHITTWERVIARRVQGEAMIPSDEENFPKVQQPTDGAWREAQKNLRAAHADLIQRVSGMKESQLNDRVPGKDYDVRFMLTGAVQHAAYHGGQIALLKKAQKQMQK